MVLPYGITWPGHPAGRACDGRNQVDYFGMIRIDSLPNLFLFCYVAFLASHCNLQVI